MLQHTKIILIVYFGNSEKVDFWEISRFLKKISQIVSKSNEIRFKIEKYRLAAPAAGFKKGVKIG